MSVNFDLSAVDWSSDLQSYLQPFYENGHMHLTAFAFWMFVHFVSGYYYKNYTNFIQNGVAAAMESDKQAGKQSSEVEHHHRVELQLMAKTVALVHAFVSSICAIIAFTDSHELTLANAYVYEPLYYYGCIFSSGYFIYDFVMAVFEGDVAFFFHGVFAYALYGHSAMPFMNHTGMLALIYEISTVFLNIRFLMIATGDTKHRMFNVVQWLFFCSFMLVRMVWGSWFALTQLQPFLFGLLTHQNGIPHSHIAVMVFSACNMGLQLLNVIWSVMMVKAAVAHLSEAKAEDNKPKTA